MFAVSFILFVFLDWSKPTNRPLSDFISFHSHSITSTPPIIDHLRYYYSQLSHNAYFSLHRLWGKFLVLAQPKYHVILHNSNNAWGFWPPNAMHYEIVNCTYLSTPSFRDCLCSCSFYNNYIPHMHVHSLQVTIIYYYKYFHGNTISWKILNLSSFLYLLCNLVSGWD